VHTLGRQTGYGSRQVLAVVARQPGWLGVLSPALPNSRAGWIPSDAAELLLEPYALEVDLSARRIVVRRKGRAVRRVKVAIGRAGTTTPTGRFAVTDALRMDRSGAGPYGCCALALTGRQPKIPQNWGGGDRLAIHGTTDETVLGRRVSLGCVRASNRDMRWLMKRVRPGTIVRVRA
jgi:lipoprotein-anchoring transpeptidase ErfK/SrfK